MSHKYNGKPLGITMKTLGVSETPVTYDSVPTRGMGLHAFMGGAEFNEVWKGIQQLPIDDTSNLELKFRSGANRTDLPSCYGPPDITRTVGSKIFDLSSEIASWMRNRGEAP